MSTVITGGALAGALVAILNATGMLDHMIVTHTELEQHISQHAAQPHAVVAQEVEALKQEMARTTRRQTCNVLDIKISLAEQAIWQMEQSGDNSQRLIEKRRELQRLEARRRQLNCSEFA